MKRPIAISLSPNAEKKDVLLALRLLLSPFSYYHQNSVDKLEMWFKNKFNAVFAFSYTSGRAGLYEILQAIGIRSSDEVILQAFTCVALPNAILAVGATPIYVDVLKNTTMDPHDLEKKITGKTKAIIVQHTFGIPANIEEIKKIAEKHTIPLIEDCAHGIGVVYKEKYLGEYGDVSFFSFGRDKAFSSVFGGIVVTNNKEIGNALAQRYKILPQPGVFWTIQQMIHPIAFSLILPFYTVLSLGKIMLVFLQKIHALSFPVTSLEKKGIYEKKQTMRLPGAIAEMALNQLDRMEKFNSRRREIVAIYKKVLEDKKDRFIETDDIPMLRFSLLCENPDEVLTKAKTHNIYLGRWYSNAIDPKGVALEKIQYTPGSCPKAEEIASQIVNLPTYPTLSEEEVKRVISYIKRYV